MIRTTVSLTEDLYKEARKKAIDQRVAFTKIVNEALKDYLTPPKNAKKVEFRFKIYKMGRVKGKLDRGELYEHL